MIPYAPVVELPKHKEIIEQKQGPIKSEVFNTEEEAKENGGYVSQRFDGKWVSFGGK